MLWLSKERNSCRFNCATFRLPWVRSLHCPSKNLFLFFDANSLERQHIERAHGKRKVAQLKRQRFLSLESQSVSNNAHTSHQESSEQSSSVSQLSTHVPSAEQISNS